MPAVRPHPLHPPTGQSPWRVITHNPKLWPLQKPQLRWAQGPLPGGEGFAIWSNEGLVYLGYLNLNGIEEELAQRQKAWPGAQFREAPATEPIFQDLQQERYQGALVLVGTDFQLEVWQALLRIPSGQLTSYGMLAQALGRPGGAQAIGQAVGSNPISLLVPCHRVIANNGKMGGYHWGLQVKHALLARELKTELFPE